MSVVSADWRDPASWLKLRMAYGMVRDGDTLRFCRMSKSGAQSTFECDLDTWGTQPDFRKQLEKDHVAGALLISGLEPHRVMLRSLVSPLKEKEKSAEIWGTLLDAAIPFPLEKCQVTFLPTTTLSEGGRRCLAVAARMEDVQQTLGEWAELGLEPDLIFPEELMLPNQQGNPLWLGHSRTIFSTWQDGIYTGGGGALKPEQRAKQLARFEQALPPDAGPADWQACGPESEGPLNALENALAAAGLHRSPAHANLRADPFPAQKLQKIYAKKQKTLKVTVLILLLMLFLFPLMLRHQLRAYQNYLRADIASIYQRFTGSQSNATGKDLLLMAQRYQEEKWGDFWSTADRLSQPMVSPAFVEIALAAKETGLVFTQVDLQANHFELHLLGNEDKVTAFSHHLKDSGWKVTRSTGADGTWRLLGERGA